MGQTVTFTIDAKHAAAVQAFLNVANAIDQTAAKGGKAGQVVSNAGAQAGDSWARANGIFGILQNRFVQLTTGVGAFYKALQLASAEIERIGSLQLKAHESLKGGMPDYQRALYSFDSDYVKSKDFERRNREGIQAYGSKNFGEYFDMAASGASAHGRVDMATTHEAVNLVAKFTGQKGLKPDESRDLVGNLMDLMNARLDKGEKADPEELLGIIGSGFRESRSTTIHEAAVYDARTILNTYLHHGMPLDEGTALQATVAHKIPDPKGRRASTGAMGIMDAFRKAYGDVSFYAPRKDIPDAAAWDALGFEKKIEAMQGQDEFGKMMRAHLIGNLSSEQDVRDLSLIFGKGYGGSLEGESGLRGVAEDFLKPDNESMKLFRKAKSGVVTGDAARQYTRDMTAGSLRTPQEKYFAQVKSAEGGQGAREFDNVLQAQRGLVLEQVNEAADFTKDGVISKWVGNLVTEIQSSTKKTGPELDQFLIDKLEATKSKLLGQIKPGEAHEALEWAKQADPERFSRLAPFTQSDTFFGLPKEKYEEWRKSKMSDEERSHVEDINQTIRSMKRNVDRGGASGAEASWDEEPRKPFPEFDQWKWGGKRPFLIPPRPSWLPLGIDPEGREYERQRKQYESQNPDVKAEGNSRWLPPGTLPSFLKRPGAEASGDEEPAAAPGQPAKAAPASTDQSLNEVISELRQLASAIREFAGSDVRRMVDVRLEDKAGRPLSRATSRPRAIEQFYDEAIG